MRAPKTLEQSFSKSPDEVYAALKKVATAKPYTLSEADDGARKLEFESGGSLTSMGHFVFAAELTAGGGGTKVLLQVHTGENTAKAILDGWKNRKAGEKLLQRLHEAV